MKATIRELEYLVALAQHRHFGRAAKACFVSQPTLSMQIRKLEEQCDVILVERGSRTVRLTAAGKAIVKQAERVLDESNKLMQLATQYRDPFGGELKMGVIPTVAPYLLPKILRLIYKRFPNLAINLAEAKTSEIHHALEVGELDIGILALPTKKERFIEKQLYREPFLVAMSSRHPKVNTKRMRLSDLENEQVLLLEDGHCFRDQALEICNSHFAVENTNYRASSLETLREMVAVNAGITLIPELAVRRSGGVKYVPFRKPVPYRDIGLCWRASSPRQELLNEMVNLLRPSR